MHRYRRSIITGLFLFYSAQIAVSQGVTSTDIRTLICKAREKYKLPAIAITVLSSESIKIKEISGVRNMESNEPVTLDSYFHIGSCSKSALSLIAGMLIEENKIEWNSRFFSLFPELEKTAEPEYLSITLEDLLLCEAGIQPFTSGAESIPEIEPVSSNKRYDFARYLLGNRPSTERRSNGRFGHIYSNASYSLASLMLEKAADMTYEELIEIYIDRQLGIETYLGFPNTIDPRQPWGHLIQGESIEVFPPDHEYRIPDLLQPAGDLCISPFGLAEYTQKHLLGLLGKDETLPQSVYQHIHFGFKGFSLGIANGEMAGFRFSGMDGSAGTFFCRLIIVPDADFAFTIMTNAGSGTGEMKAIDWLTMKIVKHQFNWWWKFWM